MKHNVMKRTLAGVMAVLTVAAYMPANVGGFLTEGNGFGIVASAEGEVISLNSLEANDDGELVLGTGSYILSQDANLGMITIAENAIVTLDLNGYKITTDKHSVFVKGELTITDNSTSQNGTIESLTESVISINTGGVLTIDAGNFISQEVAVLFGKKVYGATATINGGVFTTHDNFVLGFNGTERDAGTEDQVNTLNVNGGTFNGNITSTGYVACGIYCPQNDNVVVNGGIFNITGGAGIVSRAGTVTVNGGTFSCTGNVTGKVGDSRVVVPCSALVFDTDANYPGLTADSKITVTGGNFTSAVDSITTVGEANRVSVSGGTFNADVSAYVAEGYMQDEQGNVIAKSDYNWVLTESKTYTLEEDMVCKTITSANGVNATLDLNGHSINVAKYLSAGDYSTEENASTLSIVNSGDAAIITTGTHTYIDPYSVLNLGDKVTLASGAQINVTDNSTLTVGTGATVSSNTAWTIVPYENSIINIYGTVTNTYNTDGDSGYAISGNHDWSMGSVINIYDGAVVEAPYGNAIYHPQEGTLNINGGTILGATAVYARTGTINISDGYITGIGSSNTPSQIANGADPTGDALAIQVYVSSYGSVPVLNITGGHFNSENGLPVATYWTKAIDEAQMPTKFITGGWYTGVLNKSFIADGYVLKDDIEIVKATEQLATPVTITTIDVNGASTAETVYQEYYKNGDYTLPKNVYLDGFEFKGWKVNNVLYPDSELANDQINYLVGSGEPVIVQIVYDKIVYHSNVSVSDGTIVNISNATTNAVVETSTVVKVQANAPTSGMKFSHWLSNGKIVSYNTTYSFYAPEGEVNLEAVYVIDTSTVAQQGTGFIEKVSKPTANKMAFVSVLNVPDGCKMLKAGVVVQGTDTLNGAALTINNAKAIRYTDTSKNNYRTFKYTFTLQTSNLDKKWTVRPYLEYKDKSGKVQTIYGDSVSNCINDFN